MCSAWYCCVGEMPWYSSITFDTGSFFTHLVDFGFPTQKQIEGNPISSSNRIERKRYLKIANPQNALNTYPGQTCLFIKRNLSSGLWEP